MTSAFAFPERLPWRLGTPLLLGLALALLPGKAAAQALPIELTWQAPAECPNKEAVLSRARSLLGSKTTKVDKVHAEGTIRKGDERYELTLLIDENGQIGERKVWARQCEELSGAAAISLVLLLTSGHDGSGPGSDAGTTSSTAGSPSTLPTAANPAPKPSAPSPSDPEPPASERHRSWRLLVSAPQLAVSVGPLPKPSLGLAVGIGVQGHAWSVQLVGQWYDSAAVVAPIQPYGAEVERIAAGLWGCWDLQRQGWSFSPCLRGSVTHLSATGYGPYLLPATQSETSFGVGIGAIGRLRAAEWLALMVSAGVQVELSRPVISLKTLGTVRQLAPLSAIVQLGPEWIF